MTRSRSIKAKCLDCRTGDKTAVRGCPCLDCPLWDYRFGRTPQGGYGAFLDRDFFERYLDVEQRKFNRLLLAEAHRRDKNRISKTDGQIRN